MTRAVMVLLLTSLLVPMPLAAQNPLVPSDSSSAEMAVPEPASLGPGWWRYLGEAQGDELRKRAGDLKQAIDRVVLSLEVADSSAAVSAAERAKAEIDAYLQVRSQQLPANPLNLRNEGSFSLSEYLEARQRVREIDLTIRRTRVELEEISDLQELERRRVDESLSSYLELGDGVHRIVAGLDVIADRALLAVTQLRRDRKVAELQNLELRQEAYRTQATTARNNLQPGELDSENQQSRIDEVSAELDEAAQATRDAKAAFLDLDPANEYADIRGSYARQRLLAANLEETGLRLRRGIARASLAWLGLHKPKAEIDIDASLALVTELRELTKRVDEDSIGWQRVGDQLLITPPTRQIREREIRLLRDRTLELGQDNFKNLQSLNLLKGELNDLTELLNAAIAAREGGVSGFWRRTLLIADGVWEQITSLGGIPLFRFGDVPVTSMVLLRMVLTIAGALVISLLLRRGLERLGHKRHIRDRSSLYLLGRLAHYVIITVAILLALTTLGLDFTSVALVAGALSVGIGFGLQNIVNNFVSGLVLMFDRSLKIGDYIELDTGLTGQVREIKVRSTRINTNDNVDVLVPNSEFFNARLVNWTHTDGLARFRIPFGVAYGSDKEKVREAALQAADDVEYTLHNMPGKEPQVWMTGFGESSLDFLLLVWVSRGGVRRPSRVRSAYLWAIDDRLREAGVEIPFPQRDLHLRSGLFPSEGESD